MHYNVDVYDDESTKCEYVSSVQSLVRPRRVYLIAHEHIPARTPRRVRAAHKPCPPELLDPRIGGVEVVLELGNQLRAFRTATLHAIADIEDDEPIVPVGEVGEAVHHHDVVEIAPRLGLLRL